MTGERERTRRTMLWQWQFFGSSRPVFSLHRANEQREFGKPEIMVLNVFHFHPFSFFLRHWESSATHTRLSLSSSSVASLFPHPTLRYQACQGLFYYGAWLFDAFASLRVVFSLSLSAALSLSLIVVVDGRENSGERTVSDVGRLHNKDMTTMLPGVGFGRERVRVENVLSQLLNRRVVRSKEWVGGMRHQHQKRKEKKKEKIADEKFRLVYCYWCVRGRRRCGGERSRQSSIVSSCTAEQIRFSTLRIYPSTNIKSEWASQRVEKSFFLLLLLPSRTGRKEEKCEREILWAETFLCDDGKICAFFFSSFFCTRIWEWARERENEAKDLEIYKYISLAVKLLLAKSLNLHDLSHPHHCSSLAHESRWSSDELSQTNKIEQGWTQHFLLNIWEEEEKNSNSSLIFAACSLLLSYAFLEFSDSFAASFSFSHLLLEIPPSSLPAASPHSSPDNDEMRRGWLVCWSYKLRWLESSEVKSGAVKEFFVSLGNSPLIRMTDFLLLTTLIDFIIIFAARVRLLFSVVLSLWQRTEHVCLYRVSRLLLLFLRVLTEKHRKTFRISKMWWELEMVETILCDNWLSYTRAMSESLHIA